MNEDRDDAVVAGFTMTPLDRAAAVALFPIAASGVVEIPFP